MFRIQKDGTKAHYDHTQLMFNSYYDFSNCFHFIAIKMSKQGLRQCEDTISIHEQFITQWIKTKEFSITNLSPLSQT